MAAIPRLEEEEAKWLSRERENLVGERTRIGNKSALARLGIRGFRRPCARRLERLPTPEREPVPPNTLAELRRERARLHLLRRPDPGDRDCAPAMAGTATQSVPIRWSDCWRGFGGLASGLQTAHEAFSRGLRDLGALWRFDWLADVAVAGDQHRDTSWRSDARRWSGSRACR
jgi:hypothetical protein